MSVFACAIDALFSDPNIARDAVYTPASGIPFPVRIIERRPDVVSEFAGSRIASATALFDLRVSEVASPRPGDRIELDGEAFLIQGEPRRDAARLVWTLDTRPA
jgi:hypothetical protein